MRPTPPLLPRWDAGHKNTNTDYYDAVKEDYKLNSKVESKLEISRKKKDKSLKKQKKKSSKPYENSDKKLSEVINYYQKNIPEIKCSDINQPFKSHITSTSFYILAFYLYILLLFLLSLPGEKHYILYYLFQLLTFSVPS